jgi:hypothetical protein
MGASWKDLSVAHVKTLLLVAFLVAILLASSPMACAQQPEQNTASQGAQNSARKPLWLYGGFADLGYALDFNHPSNHMFRSRGTTPRVDEVKLNMAAVYLRKDASEQSRCGMELTVQGGEDSKIFGFSATAPNFPGGNWLRHLGPTNVSYLAPVGKGLTIQGGYFNSFIGYDSLYAKNNFNYTRPWGADFTPYFMFGINAAYPFNDKLTGALFIVNGYWHLANANRAPSFGGQLAYKATSRVTLKETLIFGPHQSNTSPEFWRTLSDSIAEWKKEQVTVAYEYQISSELVDAPGRPRALWMSAQLPMRWTMNNRWSVALRPEVAWDRDGRWTLFRQTVEAVTTTLEYRFPYSRTNTILRLEHRWDNSRGPDGGFFRNGEFTPGVVGLTPSQHVLILGVIVSLDSPSQP